MREDARRCVEEAQVPYEQDAPLGPMTWYKVGGRAEILARPTDEHTLANLVKSAAEADVPVRILGRGANLLVRDALVPGIVVKLEAEPFTSVRVAGNRLTAAAGCDLFKLVRDAARLGLAGLEVLAGIPATVGGAIRMNAGGAFGDIGSVAESLRIMRLDGQIETLSRHEAGFAYRQTAIGQGLVLDATFALEPQPVDAVKARVKEIFAYKKNSQPMGDDSAGCAFKNPPVHVGRTAGQLIDQAGLKGFAIGQATVSAVHANFIVTQKGATGRAEDIYAVIQHVQQIVHHRFGVMLEREVVVWP